MLLYHFSTSPFARRVRLALAYKNLSAELRDAREDPAAMQEVQRLNPMHTVPVLVDGERVVVDSHAIAQYLDRKQPDPPLWPQGLAGAEAFDYSVLCDAAVTTLSDVGMRYYALHTHADFPAVRDRLIARAQRALNALAQRVEARGLGVPLCGDHWSYADIAVYSTTSWLERLPARAQTQAPIRQVVGLGWSLPEALTRWADQHRERADVLALDR